jgi:hypothetical protein
MRFLSVAKAALAIFALFSIPFAQSSNPTASVSEAMANLCAGIMSLVPVASMLMLVLAGVIYAAGQMMGAETRARANVWATACLTGALIGVLIVAIAPTVLAQISGFDISCTPTP